MQRRVLLSGAVAALGASAMSWQALAQGKIRPDSQSALIVVDV